MSLNGRAFAIAGDCGPSINFRSVKYSQGKSIYSTLQFRLTDKRHKIASQCYVKYLRALRVPEKLRGMTVCPGFAFFHVIFGDAFVDFRGEF